MVKVALQVSCRLDGLKSISPSEGLDTPWTLKLQCLSCNEIDPNWHTFSGVEEVPAFQGPETFNFQMKCKFCSAVSSIDVVKDSVVKTLEPGRNGLIDKQTAVIFDCRGVYPVAHDPKDVWSAESQETGAIFLGIIDFDDGLWVYYWSERVGDYQVSIDKFRYEFERI